LTSLERQQVVFQLQEVVRTKHISISAHSPSGPSIGRLHRVLWLVVLCTHVKIMTCFKVDENRT
jgi:hypothetical protein